MPFAAIIQTLHTPLFQKTEVVSLLATYPLLSLSPSYESAFPAMGKLYLCALSVNRYFQD